MDTGQRCFWWESFWLWLWMAVNPTSVCGTCSTLRLTSHLSTNTLHVYHTPNICVWVQQAKAYVTPEYKHPACVPYPKHIKHTDPRLDTKYAPCQFNSIKYCIFPIIKPPKEYNKNVMLYLPVNKVKEELYIYVYNFIYHIAWTWMMCQWCINGSAIENSMCY